MKSEKSQIVKDTYHSYNDFLLEQVIIDLDVGDKVKIEVESGGLVYEREFEAKQINCHFNFLWQDKGIKKEQIP